MNLSDTIVALSTAQGTAAIAVIRISGNNSFKIIDKLFQSKTGKSIVESESNKAIFGEIIYKNKIVDEVIVTTFKKKISWLSIKPRFHYLRGWVRGAGETISPRVGLKV